MALNSRQENLFQKIKQITNAQYTEHEKFNWRGKCPAKQHKDSNPSFSFGVSPDNWIIFVCHAGCDRQVILDGLEIENWELGPYQSKPGKGQSKKK